MKLSKYRFTLALFAVVVLFSKQLNASVKLPRLISNGMVLQRDVPLKIWGWAEPSEKVKIQFIGKTYQTKADKRGNWKVELPATAAGGARRRQAEGHAVHHDHRRKQDGERGGSQGGRCLQLHRQTVQCGDPAGQDREGVGTCLSKWSRCAEGSCWPIASR